MKLRNKKTKEIKDINIRLLGTEPDMFVNSIAELNEEWEDYEEPKEHFVITCDGKIITTAEEFTAIDECEEIGNKFETKEEAEKAVEKLKAWKRLKDKGFEFEYCGEYENLCGNGFEIPITAIMPPESYTDVETVKDLDLLFSREDV